MGPGDIVCLMMPSCIDFAVAYAAIQRLGAVTSAVNPRLGPREVESVFARSQPVVTVIDDALVGALPPETGVVVTRSELAEGLEGPSTGHPSGPARGRSRRRRVDQRDHRSP